MKKVIVLLVSVMAVCLLFAACNCEHQYEEKITAEASCTAVGVKTFTCVECNESYTEEIPMIEHTYTSAITKEPTCAEKGVNTFTCTVCNDSYTEEIAMIDHTFGEATVAKEPTCVAEGEKTVTCTACGATEVAEKIPTVAHSYQSKVKVAATCTEKGVNTLTCSVCNDSKEEATNALGHNYQQSKVITKVTCTANGEVTMTCTRCNDSYNETKKATGHDWVAATCTKPKYCSICNTAEGTTVAHNLLYGTCQNKGCGYHIGQECSASIKPGTSANLVNYHIFHADRIWVNFVPTVYSTISMSVCMEGAFTYTQGNGISYDSYLVVVYDSSGNVIKSAEINVKGVVGEKAIFHVDIGTVSEGNYTVEFRHAR